MDLLFYAPNAFATHPLITEDTGTIGTGKAHLELLASMGMTKKTASPEILAAFGKQRGPET